MKNSRCVILVLEINYLEIDDFVTSSDNISKHVGCTNQNIGYGTINILYCSKVLFSFHLCHRNSHADNQRIISFLSRFVMKTDNGMNDLNTLWNFSSAALKQAVD